MKKPSIFLKTAAAVSIAGLALTACGEDNGDTEDNGGDEVAGNGETINLGYIETWTDGLSTTLLWQVILEEQGYEVDTTGLTDAAPVYAGLADGSLDVYPSAWLPNTHASYMENYEGEIEDLGAYYDGAVLTLAVPGHTDVDSIEDLPANADLFDGEIIGIEAGAGHMETTADSVMPGYGLDEDFELIESSTGAIMATLDDALENGDDVVVTLWRPFWAYDGERDIKDLEDPDELLGGEETLNVVANADFAEEHSDVAEWMSNLELSDEEYAELEDLVVNEHDGDIAGAEEWVENNREIVDDLINS